MTHSLSLDRDTSVTGAVSAGAPARAAVADDKVLIRAAATVTRDLNQAKPAIYWADLIASVVVGYGALAAAILAPSSGWMIAAMIVAILGLYRAGSFIHELTHIKHSAVPGFRFGWNALVGVPLLLPSFMYEGVHNLHHARTRYGTVEDPEYLPLALMKPWTVPLFVVVAALAPIALLFRFAVLTPLSFLIPPLRRIVVERYSGLVINPVFRRRAADGALKRQWLAQELAASAWAIALLTMTATGIVPLRSVMRVKSDRELRTARTRGATADDGQRLMTHKRSCRGSEPCCSPHPVVRQTATKFNIEPR